MHYTCISNPNPRALASAVITTLCLPTDAATALYSHLAVPINEGHQENHRQPPRKRLACVNAAVVPHCQRHSAAVPLTVEVGEPPLGRRQSGRRHSVVAIVALSFLRVVFFSSPFPFRLPHATTGVAGIGCFFR